MKCLSYNIQYGLGADKHYDLHRVANEIKDADIIALQEVDRYWQRSGDVDSPQILADQLPQHHWVYGPNLDMDASYSDNGRIVHRRKQFGTMILSRWPILSSRNHLLPKWGDRAHHSIQQGMLEAVVASPIGPLRVYSVHLSHLCAATRLPQVDRILEVIADAPAAGGAWCGGHPTPEAGWIEEPEPPMPSTFILMGDMNFDSTSEEYTRLVGPLAPKYGRLTQRHGYLDAWVVAGNDEASGRSHPNTQTRIDHCFISTDLTAHVVRVWIDQDARGSDHWPVWTELRDDLLLNA